MNLIDITDEYRDIVNSYGTLDELIGAAFSNEELSVLRGLTNNEETLKECACIRLSGDTDEYKRNNKYGYINEFDEADTEHSEFFNKIKKLTVSNVPVPTEVLRVYRKNVERTVHDNRIKRFEKKYHISLIIIQNRLDGVESLNDMILLLKEVHNENDIDTVFKAIVKTYEAYRFLTKDGKIDLSAYANVVNSMYKTAYYIKAKNGERLVTKGELKSKVSGMYCKKTCLVSSESESNILMCGYVLAGRNEDYSAGKFIWIENSHDRIKTYIEHIVRAMSYITSDEFSKDTIHMIQEQAVKIEYPDNTDDEVNHKITLIDVLKCIKKNCNPDGTDYYSTTAWKIAERALHFKNYNLTEKQTYIVTTVYDNLVRKGKAVKNDNRATNTDTGKKEFVNACDDELIRKAKIVKGYVKKHRDRNSSFFKLVVDICNKVIDKKIASDKQANIIIKVYNDNIDSSDSNKEETISKKNKTSSNDINGGLPPLGGFDIMSDVYTSI